MNKQILKNIVLFLNVGISLFCIILFRQKQLSREMFFGFHFWGYIFVINIIYSVIGIILFKLYMGENKITFSKKYLLLIPSLIISIYFILSVIVGFLSMFMSGMLIQTLILAIGSPLLLFYYLNQNYNIILFILLIILCFILPVNIIISWIEVVGLMGV
jgi:hypothetical protein